MIGFENISQVFPKHSFLQTRELNYFIVGVTIVYNLAHVYS